MSYQKLRETLLGKRVHMTSTCELFPNFNIRGRVTKAWQRPGESMLLVKLDSGREMQVGCNMRDLKYEIIH